MIARADWGKRPAAFGSPMGATPPDSTPTATYAAELARRFPDLPTYGAGRLAVMLARLADRARLHAVRMCNGEATARGDVPGYGLRRYLPGGGWQWEHDPDAERIAGERLQRKAGRWLAWLQFWGHLHENQVPCIVLGGDPRGCCLEVVWSGKVCGHCAGENGEHGIGCPDDPMPNAIADQQGHD